MVKLLLRSLPGGTLLQADDSPVVADRALVCPLSGMTKGVLMQFSALRHNPQATSHQTSRSGRESDWCLWHARTDKMDRLEPIRSASPAPSVFPWGTSANTTQGGAAVLAPP